MLLSCKIEISLLMAVLCTFSFPKRLIGFSFQVLSILDISDDLVKKIFMSNTEISYASKKFKKRNFLCPNSYFITTRSRSFRYDKN